MYLSIVCCVLSVSNACCVGVDASPLMTWGEVEGTPLRLETDIVATPGPTFKMPKVPKRDELAHKLADKASKSQRDKKKRAMAQATSTLLSVRLASISYAQVVIEQVL